MSKLLSYIKGLKALLSNGETIPAKLSAFEIGLKHLEDRLNAIELSINAERDSAIHSQTIILRELEALNETENLVARQQPLHFGEKIRCIFLIHHAPAWDSLADVFDAMRMANDFEPVVISISHDFNHSGEFSGEGEVHKRLEFENVPHIRLPGDLPTHLSALKAYRPHVIFRQSPWEPDVPPAFRTEEISFARLCYVPYFANSVIKGRDAFEYDQYFHRMCWRLFCINQFHYNLALKGSFVAPSKLVVSGHPKFDRLLSSAKDPYWPINRGKESLRVIWDSHHSVQSEWLGFGNFHKIYSELLTLARENEDIEIVFTAHPKLFESNASGLMTKAQIDSFLRDWLALPNTGLIEKHVPYAKIFAASDAMVTNGISFLTEYQLFNKPIIFFDSQQHEPFNDEGEITVLSTHRAVSIPEILKLLRSFADRTDDGLATERRKLIKRIMPYPGRSAENIVEEIRKGLAIESAHSNQS